jgi:hypothetical protein
MSTTVILEHNDLTFAVSRFFFSKSFCHRRNSIYFSEAKMTSSEGPQRDATFVDCVVVREQLLKTLLELDLLLGKLS